METSYKKMMKTVRVSMLPNGQTVNILDVKGDDKATRALNEFKAYGDIHYEINSGSPDEAIVTIPYHAVRNIEVTEVEASINLVDPYYCEDDK